MLTDITNCMSTAFIAMKFWACGDSCTDICISVTYLSSVCRKQISDQIVYAFYCVVYLFMLTLSRFNPVWVLL